MGCLALRNPGQTDHIKQDQWESYNHLVPLHYIFICHLSLLWVIKAERRNAKQYHMIYSCFYFYAEASSELHPSGWLYFWWNLSIFALCSESWVCCFSIIRIFFIVCIKQSVNGHHNIAYNTGKIHFIGNVWAHNTSKLNSFSAVIQAPVLYLPIVILLTL